MKIALSYAFIVFCLIQTLLFMRSPDQDILSVENRKVAAWPAKPRLTQNGIKDFFADLNLFFNDRIILRQQMLEIAADLNSAIGEQTDFENSYWGQEGWLFIGNKYDQITDKLVGRLIPKANHQWSRTIQKERTRFPEIPIIFLIGPNKHTVYPEYLPSFIKPGPTRYIGSLLEELKALGVVVVDPSYELRQAKADDLVYYKTDSHWNLLGASIAAEKLASICRTSSIYNAKFPEYKLTPIRSNQGDLAGVANLNLRDIDFKDTFALQWLQPGTHLEMKECNNHSYIEPTRQIPPIDEGPVIIKNPEAKSKLKVWFFRDSFGVALSPYVHSMFAEVWHFSHSSFWPRAKSYHGYDFSKEDADLGDKPDLIIFEIAERRIP